MARTAEPRMHRSPGAPPSAETEHQLGAMALPTVEESTLRNRTSAQRRPSASILMTCAHDSGTGGLQSVFRDLVRYLEGTGRSVHLIYPAPLPSLRRVQATNTWGRIASYCPLPTIVNNSVPLSVPLLGVYLPIAQFHLTRLIRRNKIDVINCHGLSPYFLHLAIAARLWRIPLVLSVHGAEIDGYAARGAAQRLLLRLVVRSADRVVACSRALARQTSEAFPGARGKITYVHNGLDLSQFAENGSAPPVDGPFVLTVCRQVEKKGVDTLLRAFALVLRDVPTLSLVVIGDGPLLERNKALARTLQIEPQVRFVGDVPRAEVLAAFAACTLFVLPSRAEPFGLVLLEAAHYRKAIVGTRVGGIPEIVADHVSGVLVEPDDPAAMAAQMSRLLRNPDVAERLGVRAHQTLMSRFRWEDRGPDYTAIYEGARGPSVLDSDAGPPP